MKTALLIALVLLAPGAYAQKKKPPVPAEAQPPAFTGPKKRVAVTAMEVKVQGVATTAPTPSGGTTVVTLDLQQPTEFGTGLADMLVTSLSESKRFIVLERQNFEEIAKERQLAAGDGFDQTVAVKAGRLLGAQVLVRGAVTELSFKKSASQTGGIIGDLAVGKAKAEALVALDLKFIDVETGQVLESVRAEGRAGSTQTTLALAKSDIKLGNTSFNSSPLGLAVRDAINKAVQMIISRMEKVVWEARVAAVMTEDQTTLLYLSAGADSGLKVGDVLTILRPGTEIVDPQTGLILGHTEAKLLGKCRVKSIQNKLTIATLEEGSDIQRNDMVRLPGAPQ